MKVSILTGGSDKTYAFGLLLSLIGRGVEVDFIGSDELNDENIINRENVNFYNLRGDQNPKSPFHIKINRVLVYYIKLLVYTMKTDSKVFHILWLNKFVFFDRTIMNLIYKMFGKKLVFTAHNIDQQERDRKSTKINKISLQILYNIVDHIFVHTEKMKYQLINEFNIDGKKIKVIPFGINTLIPVTDIKREEAKKKLGLNLSNKIILFFGRIAPYKGLELLISAFDRVVKSNDDYRLVIAGQTMDRNSKGYWKNIKEMIVERELQKYIIQRIEYIPDEDIEIYYKSADVLILPYSHIFQTGVLFISYYFGLPVIATDVGSFREDIIDGKTGLVCNKNDEIGLSGKIIEYFNSNLYDNIENNCKYIQEYANEKYSWDKVSLDTIGIYKKVLNI